MNRCVNLKELSENLTLQEKERRFESQQNERRERILDALTADERPVISIAKLADAIGSGCTKEQLQNAAWENHLPFGFACRGKHAESRGTVVLKDVFWKWWNTGYVRKEVY